MAIQRFTDIRAWQSARELVRLVYSASSDGALTRDFALRDQLRRAAISTMTNIAEGFSRGSDPDFARFLDFSRASATEVQSLLFACLDTERLPKDVVDEIMSHAEITIALIARFQAYLRNPRAGEPEDHYSA